jgi:hypothetical protein
MTMSAPTDDNTQPPMDLKPMRASSIQSGPLGVARVIIGLFSGTGVRDPPTGQKKQIQHVRLNYHCVQSLLRKGSMGSRYLEFARLRTSYSDRIECRPRSALRYSRMGIWYN